MGRPQLRVVAQVQQDLALVGCQGGVQGRGHGCGVPGVGTATLHHNRTCQVGHAKCLGHYFNLVDIGGEYTDDEGSLTMEL